MPRPDMRLKVAPLRRCEHCGAVAIQVPGEPASKSNSRKLVFFGGKPRFVKSKKALELSKLWDKLCPQLEDPLDGVLTAHIRLFYATQRPDLDESLILDLLQGRVIRNDRQIRERHTYHGIDKDYPRSEVLLSPMGTCAGNSIRGCLRTEFYRTSQGESVVA